MTDLSLYYMEQARIARADARQARGERDRMAKKVELLHEALTGLLDDFARPGDPTIDLTTLVLDTQTRVLQETRNE